MVQINFAQRSVNVKIVYYGPGMSGKTTNLEIVHQRAPESNRGELTSISTDGDRTLFFDFMPLDLGTVAGMRTQFQLYTVPGQVYYNSTRKLVLQGVDGVIFIADSSAAMLQENLESLKNLQENLLEYGKSLETIPWVIQYNKRDLPDALSVEELQRALNPLGVPAFEGIANTGQGVFPTLKSLAARVLESIHSTSGLGGKTPEVPMRPAAPAAPAIAPKPVAAAPALSSTGFHPQAAIPRGGAEAPLAQPVMAASAAQAPYQAQQQAAPHHQVQSSLGLGGTAPSMRPHAPLPNAMAPTAAPVPAAHQEQVANTPLESTALRLRMGAVVPPPTQGALGGGQLYGAATQAPLMQARPAPAPQSAAAPARRAQAAAPAAAAPAPSTRLKPRTPQPTPKGSSSKSTAVIGLILGLTLVAGALVAKYVFNIF